MRMTKPAVLSAVLSAAAVSFVVPATALEMPARKPGLWEMKMEFVGRNLPGMTTQQCLDAETDKQLGAMGNSMAQGNCPKQDVQRSGNTIIVDSVCDFGGHKTVAHSVATGDFNSAYTVDVESKREGGPAVPGLPAESKMKISATWVGPCKADQKPGDMIMPNGMKINIKNMPGLGGAPR